MEWRSSSAIRNGTKCTASRHSELVRAIRRSPSSRWAKRALRPVPSPQRPSPTSHLIDQCRQRHQQRRTRPRPRPRIQLQPVFSRGLRGVNRAVARIRKHPVKRRHRLTAGGVLAPLPSRGAARGCVVPHAGGSGRSGVEGRVQALIGV
jgi:hypothetical protein